MKFIGKKITESATSLISGAADVVIGAAGDIAQTATSKIMNVGTEIHKNQLEKATMSTQMHEEKLTKLKSMFDAGIITQEEFTVNKSEILLKM